MHNSEDSSLVADIDQIYQLEENNLCNDIYRIKSTTTDLLGSENHLMQSTSSKTTEDTRGHNVVIKNMDDLIRLENYDTIPTGIDTDIRDKAKNGEDHKNIFMEALNGKKNLNSQNGHDKSLKNTNPIFKDSLVTQSRKENDINMNNRFKIDPVKRDLVPERLSPLDQIVIEGINQINIEPTSFGTNNNLVSFSDEQNRAPKELAMPTAEISEDILTLFSEERHHYVPEELSEEEFCLEPSNVPSGRSTPELGHLLPSPFPRRYSDTEMKITSEVNGMSYLDNFPVEIPINFTKPPKPIEVRGNEVQECSVSAIKCDSLLPYYGIQIKDKVICKCKLVPKMKKLKEQFVTQLKKPETIQDNMSNQRIKEGKRSIRKPSYLKQFIE